MQLVLSVFVCLSLAQKTPLGKVMASKGLLSQLTCLNREKIMTTCSFETLSNVHGSCKSCISIGHSYQPHPLSMPCSLLYVHAQTTGLLQSLTRYIQRRQHGRVRAGYVLSRAPVLNCDHCHWLLYSVIIVSTSSYLL